MHTLRPCSLLARPRTSAPLFGALTPHVSRTACTHAQLIDVDGTASITVDDLKAMLATIGASYTDAQVEAALAQADFDGDGLVTLDDFQKVADAVKA